MAVSKGTKVAIGVGSAAIAGMLALLVKRRTRVEVGVKNAH